VDAFSAQVMSLRDDIVRSDGYGLIRVYRSAFISLMVSTPLGKWSDERNMKRATRGFESPDSMGIITYQVQCCDCFTKAVVLSG